MDALVGLLTAAEESLQLISESCAQLGEEHRVELVQRQTSLREALSKVKSDYNAMAAEFERLPLWVVFKGRSKSLPQISM